MEIRIAKLFLVTNVMKPLVYYHVQIFTAHTKLREDNVFTRLLSFYSSFSFIHRAWQVWQQSMEVLYRRLSGPVNKGKTRVGGGGGELYLNAPPSRS